MERHSPVQNQLSLSLSLPPRSGGLLGSHRSPIPCYFSGQCCNPGSPPVVSVGYKELGCGLLPSRPSWSQGTSLMKATPGNFPAVGEITTALKVTVEASWDYTEQLAQGLENCGWPRGPGYSCPGCTLHASGVTSPHGHQK